MMDDRCESCREDALTIEVKRSAYGYAMYLVVLVAAAMLVLYYAYSDLHASFAGFVGSIGSGPYLAVVFGLIFVSFVLSFLDLGRTNKMAREQIEQRKAKTRD
jgi:hypothetical protein